MVPGTILRVSNFTVSPVLENAIALFLRLLSSCENPSEEINKIQPKKKRAVFLTTTKTTNIVNNAEFLLLLGLTHYIA